MPQSRWWDTCGDCIQVRSCMPRFWPHQKAYRVALFGKQQHLSNLLLPCRWTWRAGRRWESPSVWTPTQGRWKRSCRSFWIDRCSFLLLARSSTRCLGCCLRSLNFASTFDLVIIIDSLIFIQLIEDDGLFMMLKRKKNTYFLMTALFSSSFS